MPRRHGSIRGPKIGLEYIEFCFLFFVFCIFLIGEDAVSFGLTLITVYSVCRFLEVVFNRNFLPASAVFWLYHSFFLLIPGWFQYYDNFYPWSRVSVDLDIVHSLQAATIEIACFSFFYRKKYASERLRVLQYTERSNDVISTIDIKRVGLIFLGLIPTLVLIKILGASSFLQARGEMEGAYESETMAMLYNSAKFSIFGIAIVMASYWVNGSMIRGRRIFQKSLVFKFIAIFSICLAIFVNNPISSPRFHFLGMALGVIFVIFPFAKRTTWRIFWLAAPIFLYVFFPLVKNLKSVLSQSVLILPDTLSYLEGGVDFDGFQQMANIAKLVDWGGISWGNNFLSAIFFWVPRSFWSWKAVPTGQLAADYVGYAYGNLSAPFLAEAYYGLGLIGGAAILGVAGWYLAKLDCQYQISLRQKTIDLRRILAGVIVGFLFILMRGSLNSVFPQIGVALVVVLVLSPRVINMNKKRSNYYLARR